MPIKDKAEWGKSVKSIKATQVAFEMEQKIASHIRALAVQEGLTPSDQIRKMIGLSYSPPKRPRLTVTLSEDDYKNLGEKYGIDSTDTMAIRRKIMENLVGMVKQG